jgi:hypothetical protein
MKPNEVEALKLLDGAFVKKVILCWERGRGEYLQFEILRPANGRDRELSAVVEIAPNPFDRNAMTAQANVVHYG